MRDAVLLNAAAALVAYDGSVGDLDRGLRDGIERGAQAIDDGSAGRLLERWVQVSRELIAASRG